VPNRLPGDTSMWELGLLATLVPADLIHASTEWKRLARRKGLLDAKPIEFVQQPMDVSEAVANLMRHVPPPPKEGTP
jgi:hypothetical protein